MARGWAAPLLLRYSVAWFYPFVIRCACLHAYLVASVLLVRPAIFGYYHSIYFICTASTAYVVYMYDAESRRPQVWSNGRGARCREKCPRRRGGDGWRCRPTALSAAPGWTHVAGAGRDTTEPH